jgi:hypothetical protein
MRKIIIVFLAFNICNNWDCVDFHESVQFEKIISIGN